MMRTLAALAIVPALTSIATSAELVTNGGFDDATGWWATQNLTLEIVDRQLCVNVPGGTTNPWDAIVGTNDLPLVKGETYDFSFAYRGDPSGPVRALVLGCTTAGAIRGVQPSPDTIQQMIRNQSLTGDEALEAGWQLGYSRSYIEANRDALFARARSAAEIAAPRDSYIRQVLAAAKHDTYDRLHRVACPVMIIHGAEDVMIPVQNAHLLKDCIAHAELHVLEDLGHGYNLEGQAVADDLVLAFLDRCAQSEKAAHAVR